MIKYITLLICAFFYNTQDTFGAHRVELDLWGKGTTQTVSFPHPYFKKGDNDVYKCVTQGACHIATVEEINKVIVIGPVQPCVAITVRNERTAACFHAHSTSSPESMNKVLKEAFPHTLSETVAHIFSAADNVEWAANNRTRMHGGKSHEEAIEDLQQFLMSVGVPKDSIQRTIYDKRDTNGQLKYENLALGRYELAEVCVAVRMNNLFTPEHPRMIQYFNIDLATEDVFGFSGSYLSSSEIQSVAKPTQKTPTAFQNISYDALPELYASHNYLDDSGIGAGVRIQRGVVERYEESCKIHATKLFFKNL
jgi:hypothetical protein